MALIGRKDSSDSAAPPRRNRSNRAEETGPTFADDPLDPMLDVKKRARRRLIGAIALVIGAIVFVPMVFEPQSRPVVDDISIQIPDKNTRFEQAAPAKPMVAAPEPVSPPPTESVAENTAPPESFKDKAVTVPAHTVSPSSEPATLKSSVNKSVETKPTEPKVTEPVKPATDDARAVALLEGKATPATEAKSETFAVQIGAFSDADKLKLLREKLSSGGFKTYTEVVKTTQGERTRLRLGPYPSRAEADKVQERIKKLFVLDATVVPL